MKTQDAVLENARELYKGFVSVIGKREGRKPDNLEIGKFFYFCEVLNENDNFEKYIHNPNANEETALEFSRIVAQGWVDARKNRKFNISHEGMLDYLLLK